MSSATASEFEMTVKAGGGGDFAKPPPGNHPARLVAIVGLGTQWNDGFGGKPGRWQKKGYFVWELVTKAVDGQPGKNHLIARDLTLSSDDRSTLRKWLEARTGKKLVEGAPLNLAAELGQPCLLNVVLSEKGYARIDGMTGVPDGFTVPAAKTRPFTWPFGHPGRDASPAAVDAWRAALTSRLAELPDWLPWHYGKAVGEHVLMAKEVTGDTHAPLTGVRPADGPPTVPPAPAGSANPGTGTGGTGAARPPRPAPHPRVVAEPADDTEWAVLFPGAAEWQTLTAKECRAAFQARPGDFDGTVMAPADGSGVERSAAGHGYKSPIPF